MKTSLKLQRNHCFLTSILLGCFLSAAASLHARELVLWRETFEASASLWTADRGGWQFGEPDAAGPQPIEGRRSAAVGLRANYPNGLGTSFIRDEYFTVPPADQNPRLRFHHWFNTWSGDFGEVRIRRDSGEVHTISDRFDGFSDWSRCSLSLEQFANTRIRVEFYFESNSDNFIARGWHIDDVALVTGSTEFTGFESFEGPQLWSFSDWTSTKGNWKIGQPVIGPGKAYQGTNCAGVGLTANYPNGVSSSLLSPYFVVPPADQNPRLQFYHWIDSWSGDFGQLRIREKGGQAVPLSPRFSGETEWSRASLSLTEFAGKQVRVELYFESNADNFIAAGWFVDDLQLITGDFEFRGVENFEAGAAAWASTNGSWQIGPPLNGPTAAFGGLNCAGVQLSGNYKNGTSSALVSPPFLVPPADQNPRVRFQHWFNTWDGDFGEVLVRDDAGQVQSLSAKFSGNSDWTRTTLSLSSVAGKTVQLLFYFEANVDNFIASGWFIDDIELLPAPQNNWPALSRIGAQIASASGPVTFSAQATDTDFGQSLTYSIDPVTAPAGATINPQTGAFSWNPTASERSGGVRYIRVRATDNGTPQRSTSDLVPIVMPGSIELLQSHLWEPSHIKVLGAAPGLQYTSYSITNIQNNSLFPDSSPLPIGNFEIRARGEAIFFSEPRTNKASYYAVKGDLAAP